MKMTHVSASKVKHRRQKNSPQHSGIMKGENLELGLKFCFQILFGTLAINSFYGENPSKLCLVVCVM